jgi:DNA-binding CsgD family transcriptional regulator
MHASTLAAAGVTPAAETDIATVIGEIYDAATRPELWPSVMETCRQFVGGMSATIFAKNVTGTQFRVHSVDGRFDAEVAGAYAERFATIDPSNPIQVFAEVDNAIITSRVVDLEDFLNSRFAREWAQPSGFSDMVVAPIVRRANWSALFGVFFHERDGLADETSRQRVTLLAPHIRRAVAISDMLRSARTEAASFRDIIDGLAAGVFLVDVEGRLVHANAAGRALLGGAVRTGRDGELRLERTSLKDLLPNAGSIDQGSLPIETPDGERFVAHVLPLTGGARQFVDLGGEAVAALFVQPASFEPESIPASLAKAFNLTPSELRVTLATIRHDGAADVAESLGIGEATVRTHLHRIFAKTETKRQADLVKLVAGYASPFAKREKNPIQ